MATRTSRLIDDLTKVPNIVGGLGLSIAAAQKAFNLDYMDNIERLVALVKMLLGGKKLGTDGKPVDMTGEEKGKVAQFDAVFKDLLSALAPPRYQYTETTLAVRLDLAQTMDMSAEVGLGVGFGGVSLNAAFAIGYGYDYRAAAECRTVINAIPADKTVFAPLMERANKLSDKVLELPPMAQVDQRVFDASRNAFNKMTEIEAPKPVEVPAATD